MAQACSICTRDDRFEIDRLLAAGKSKSGIARTYGLDNDSVRRHFRAHLAPDIAAAARRQRLASAGNCLQVVRRILVKALETLDAARDVKESSGAVTAAVNCARLLGQVTGEVKQDVFALFLQQHGIRSEPELVRILEAHKESSATTVEQCEEDGVALLRWVLQQKPDRREAILLALGHTNGVAP